MFFALYVSISTPLENVLYFYTPFDKRLFIVISTPTEICDSSDYYMHSLNHSQLLWFCLL